MTFTPQFEPVDPDQARTIIGMQESKISFPILQGFVDSGQSFARLSQDSFNGRKVSSLYQSLNNYLRKHDMPIKVLQRDGQIYLKRTDQNLDLATAGQ